MNKDIWDGKSYDDTIMSPESFARFLRRRIDQGLSVEGYSYTCVFPNLQEVIDGVEITTPFKDDIGSEDTYNYPRELGEVHDTFNVEIRQGNGNPITLTRQVIRCSQDDGSYLQSMVDVLSKLRN